MRMTLAFWIVAAATGLLAADEGPQTTKSDQDLIQGVWKIVSIERGGEPLEVQQGLRIAFQGDQCWMQLGDSPRRANEANFKLLPDADPKGIDLSKPDDDRVSPGIYRLDGDTLTLALPNGPGRDRLGELVSNEGDGFSLLTLRRVPDAQPAAVAAKPMPPTAPKQAREPLYDPEADAKADIEAALAKARSQRKHVLVTFGGNWCGWCYKLHDAMKENDDLARLLRNEYVQVLVDVRANRELLRGFGKDNHKHGVPFLTVLDANGAVLTNQNTGDLEDGPRHDVAKVRAFLEQWAPERLDAESVFKRACERAKQESKSVLLHAGAPWCGWCGRLEDFLHQNASLLDKDYVVVKIDIERMDHGSEVVQRLRTTDGGIPWMIILSPDGVAQITSEGPDGNIGCPVVPAEIDHFMKMLDVTKRRLTSADLTALEESLQKRAKRFGH